jgi:hypothetical protein
MIRNYTSLSFALLLSVIGLGSLYAHPSANGIGFGPDYIVTIQDTVDNDSAGSIDTIGQMVKALQKFKSARDTVSIRDAKNVPNLSLQQVLKGNLAGLYVQEPNGEPGTEQSMILQGASGILFNKRDVYALQPAVYLNGVPLVQENMTIIGSARRRIYWHKSISTTFSLLLLLKTLMNYRS